MATTRTYTIADIADLPSDGPDVELIEGELHSVSPAGPQHGEIGHTLHAELGAFVRRQRLGVLYTADTGIVFGRSPDTLLSPDAAFVRRERLPRPRPSSGFLSVIPDLAVEINSPHDRREMIDRKIDIYLRSGVLLVWEIDPATQTVREYRPDSAVSVLQRDDHLDGKDIVPGFSMRVAELFEYL